MSLPTLAHVARAAGVSRTTVSNAYNRPDQLSAELREHILATAAELGYPAPDPVARGLRRGRLGIVGLVYDGPLSYLFTDPAILALVGGMASVWDTANVSLALLPRLGADEVGDSVLAAAAVDGLVSVCDVSNDERVAALVRRRLPFVLIDAGPGSDAACQVGIDDRAASATATRHLLDLGHRRLAVAALPKAPGAGPTALDATGADVRFNIVAARLAGSRDAVEAAGLDWASVPVLAAPDDGSPRQAGHHIGGQLLDRAVRPTGVVAMSDELAAGILEAAAERGVAVPGDLSVVGFDDTPAAALTVPPLTTLHQPHAAKGETAARLLLDGAPPEVVEFPTHLVVRASTGPAPT